MLKKIFLFICCIALSGNAAACDFNILVKIATYISIGQDLQSFALASKKHNKAVTTRLKLSLNQEQKNKLLCFWINQNDLDKTAQALKNCAFISNTVLRDASITLQGSAMTNLLIEHQWDVNNATSQQLFLQILSKIRDTYRQKKYYKLMVGILPEGNAYIHHTEF